MTVSPYAAADPTKLDEIIRLAEARLDAQLTVGLAADQRAMTMASVLGAIDAALIGLIASLKEPAADITSLVVLIVGIGAATALAGWSARPVSWDMPGNQPCQWIDDIKAGDTLHNGRAATAQFYDEMIADNDRQLTTNAGYIRAAFLVCALTLIVSGLGLMI